MIYVKLLRLISGKIWSLLVVVASSVKFGFLFFCLCKAHNVEYLQEQLPNDLVRVDMLFQKARDAGISIEVAIYFQSIVDILHGC